MKTLNYNIKVDSFCSEVSKKMRSQLIKYEPDVILNSSKINNEIYTFLKRKYLFYVTHKKTKL